MTNVSRHPNGGGVVVGIDPAVSSDSILDETSSVQGRTRVSWASRIRDNSALKDSEVVISTLDRVVAVGSHFAFARVADAVMKNVIIRGTDRPAEVTRSELSAGVVVEGCSISNVVLEGPFLVHSDWNHTPRHRILRTDNGIVQGLIECSEDNDRLHSGCVCRPWKMWDQNEHLLRRHFVGQLGWPLSSFNSIRTTFEEWRATRRSAVEP